MQSIEMQSQIAGIRAKVDGSLGLSINTPELSSSEKVLVMSLQNLNVKLTITPEDAVDIVKVKNKMDGKSPSERLYNTIFVYYKQINSLEDFQVFYKRNIEGLIDAYKAKLLPRD